MLGRGERREGKEERGEEEWGEEVGGEEMLERDGPGNLTSLFEGRRTLRGGEVRGIERDDNPKFGFKMLTNTLD